MILMGLLIDSSNYCCIVIFIILTTVVDILVFVETA